LLAVPRPSLIFDFIFARPPSDAGIDLRIVRILFGRKRGKKKQRGCYCGFWPQDSSGRVQFNHQRHTYTNGGEDDDFDGNGAARATKSIHLARACLCECVYIHQRQLSSFFLRSARGIKRRNEKPVKRVKNGLISEPVDLSLREKTKGSTRKRRLVSNTGAYSVKFDKSCVSSKKANINVFIGQTL
jgi:hypothetical protein